MISWGIAGSGFITRAMLDGIAASDGSKAVHIFGRSADSRQALAAEYAIERQTDRFDTLIADPDVDAIYIGLPNHLHHDFATRALAAGKAVLCEKTLTLSLPDTIALTEAAKHSGQFCVEGLMYLSHPIHAKLLEFLQSGRMGQLRHVQGFYAADIWQVVNPNGGGTLFNLGCYPASLLHLVVQAMCGDAAFADRSVLAQGQIGQDGNLLSTSATIAFGDGVLATLQSTDAYGMAHSFVIATDRGTLRFESNPWLPGPSGNAFVWQPYEGAAERVEADSGFDAFAHQVKMVEHALANGKTEAHRPAPRLSDSVAIMDLLEDWQKAATAI